jgi:hypothetical protein
LGYRCAEADPDRYKAASLPASFSGLKAVTTKSGDIKFVAYAQSYRNGTAYNEELAETYLSSARIYDSIYVRHWDTYLSTTFNAVFSGTLKKTQHSRYSSAGGLKNLVAPIPNAESPYPPFGGLSDYDISADGKWVAYKSKAPDVPQANHTTAYIYLVPHDGSETPVPINGPGSAPEGIEGDSNNPVFSPDSKSLAYLQMEDPTYESDRRVIYIYDLASKKITPLATEWDRSPDSLKWTDKSTIVAGSEDEGSGNLFLIPVKKATGDFTPDKLTDGKYASAFYLASNNTLVVTGSTLYSSWYVDIVSLNPKHGTIKNVASAHEIDPELSGLGPEDISDIWFAGNWTDVGSLCCFADRELTIYSRSTPGSSTPKASTRARPTHWPSSSMADHRAHGTTPGAPAGTPRSSPTRATSLSRPTQPAVPATAMS